MHVRSKSVVISVEKIYLNTMKSSSPLNDGELENAP